MDLRVQKTLGAIRCQFFALRSACALNQVKISALCAGAKINKTTFYRHYRDVFDLSDKLENAMIADLVAAFEGIGCLFTDPDRFIRSLFQSIHGRQEEINALFGDRVEVFTAKFESVLKTQYLQAPVSAEDDVTLSFIIGGAAHVFLSDKYGFDTDAKILAALLGRLSPPQAGSQGGPANPPKS